MTATTMTDPTVDQILNTPIKCSLGHCVFDDAAGQWTRATRAWTGHGAFTEQTLRIGQILHLLTTHQEAISKVEPGWLSAGSYAGAGLDKYLSDLAAWKAGPRDKANQPKLARKQSNVTSAQLWCFDIDGDPYASELEAYETEQAAWVAAGRPAGQGPKRPDGRGVTREQLRSLILRLQQTGLLFGISTTYSSSTKSAPGCFRLRVFFFGGKPVNTFSDYQMVRQPLLRLFAELGIEIDAAPANWASVFYLPSYPIGTPENRRFSCVQAGALIDVDAYIAEGRQLTSSTPRAQTPRATAKGRGVVQSRAVRGEKLTPDLEVVLTDGRIIRALSLSKGEKHPCYSPWRNEEHPSAFVAESNGRVFLYDSSESTTRWVDGWVDGYVCQEFVEAWHTQFPLKRLEENHVCQESEDGIEAHRIPAGPAAPGSYLSDQLPPLPTEGGIVLSAPMGVGKTQVLWSLVRSAKKVIYVVDTIALAHSAARALGLTLYSDIPSGKESEYDRIVTTVHSLWRFLPASMLREAGTYPVDLLILDETPSILGALHSSTMRGSGPQAAETVAVCAALSSRVVLASADFTPGNIGLMHRLLRRYRPDMPLSVYHRPAMQHSRTLALFGGGDWEAKLYDAIRSKTLGTHPLIATATSAQTPHVWAEIAKTMHPTAKVCCITKHNSHTPETQALLADPSSMAEFDFIFYSPSIKTGVSFDFPVSSYWQSITTPLPATALLQSTMRARNILDPKVKVTITQTSGNKATDVEVLKKLALGKATATESAVRAADVHWTLNPITWDRVATDEWFLDSWAMHESELRTASNDLVRAYVSQAHRHGMRVVDHRFTPSLLTEEEIKAEKAERKALRAPAKAKLTETRIEALISAPSIDEEEAETIARSHVRTLEESAALEAHNMREFYGVSELTPALIVRDQRGRYRQTVKDFVLLSLWGKGVKQAAKYMDRLDVVHGLDRTEYHHWTLRAKLAHQLIVELLGVPLHKAHGLTLDAERLGLALEGLAKDPQRLAQIQEILGISTAPKAMQDPIKWFLRLLRKYGVISKSSQPRRADGTRTRVYTLDSGEVQTLAQVNRRKVLDMLLVARREHPDLLLSDEDQAEILRLLAA